MKSREHFNAPKGKIKWKCEHCLAVISADDKWANQEGSCPNCDEPTIFPSIKDRSKSYISGVLCVTICILISFAIIKMAIPENAPFPTKMLLATITVGFVIGGVLAIFNLLLKRPFIEAFLFSSGAGILLTTVSHLF